MYSLFIAQEGTSRKICLQAMLKRPRWDQWSRIGVRVAGHRDAADPTTALASLDALMYTPRSTLSKNGRRRFWVEMCEAVRRQPFSLTPFRGYIWRCRAAGYRTARLYLIDAKIEHERQGFEVTPVLQHAMTDAVRAVQRSLGTSGKGRRHRA